MQYEINDELIRQAIDEYKDFVTHPIRIPQYASREALPTDYARRLETIRAEGIAEGKREAIRSITLKMKALRIPPETIRDITGLTDDEIELLESSAPA